VLTGDRVTLRPIEPADYPALAAFANDIEVSVLIGGSQPLPMPLASMAALQEQRRESPDEINFVIVADDKVIGQCGLFRQDLVSRTAELGITIGDRAYWGRGYGREAVSLVVDYAFRVRNVRKVHLATLPPTSGRSGLTRLPGSSRKAGAAGMSGPTATTSTWCTWASSVRTSRPCQPG
jgi:RimJ/RimL family protein N-acetyltransferase